MVIVITVVTAHCPAAISVCSYQTASQHLFLGGHSLLCDSMFVYLARHRKENGCRAWCSSLGKGETSKEIKCFKCLHSRIIKKKKCGRNKKILISLTMTDMKSPPFWMWKRWMKNYGQINEGHLGKINPELYFCNSRIFKFCSLTHISFRIKKKIWQTFVLASLRSHFEDNGRIEKEIRSQFG